MAALDAVPYNLLLNMFQPEWLKPIAALNAQPTSGCLDWRLNADELRAISLAYLGDAIGPGGVLRTGGKKNFDDIRQRILTAFLQASVDREVLPTAVVAAAEAAQFAERNLASHSPRISISSDGIVTLQWRKPGRGAALIFVGDGTATAMINAGTKTYLDNGIEFLLKNGLPTEFANVLSEMTSV
jgi:hypothetical protein